MCVRFFLHVKWSLFSRWKKLLLGAIAEALARALHTELSTNTRDFDLFPVFLACDNKKTWTSDHHTPPFTLAWLCVNGGCKSCSSSLSLILFIEAYFKNTIHSKEAQLGMLAVANNHATFGFRKDRQCCLKKDKRRNVTKNDPKKETKAELLNPITSVATSPCFVTRICG